MGQADLHRFIRPFSRPSHTADRTLQTKRRKRQWRRKCATQREKDTPRPPHDRTPQATPDQRGRPFQTGFGAGPGQDRRARVNLCSRQLRRSSPRLWLHRPQLRRLRRPRNARCRTGRSGSRRSTPTSSRGRGSWSACRATPTCGSRRCPLAAAGAAARRRVRGHRDRHHAEDHPARDPAEVGGWPRRQPGAGDGRVNPADHACHDPRGHRDHEGVRSPGAA